MDTMRGFGTAAGEGSFSPANYANPEIDLSQYSLPDQQKIRMLMDQVKHPDWNISSRARTQLPELLKSIDIERSKAMRNQPLNYIRGFNEPFSAKALATNTPDVGAGINAPGQASIMEQENAAIGRDQAAGKYNRDLGAFRMELPQAAQGVAPQLYENPALRQEVLKRPLYEKPEILSASLPKTSQEAQDQMYQLSAAGQTDPMSPHNKAIAAKVKVLSAKYRELKKAEQDQQKKVDTATSEFRKELGNIVKQNPNKLNAYLSPDYLTFITRTAQKKGVTVQPILDEISSVYQKEMQDVQAAQQERGVVAAGKISKRAELDTTRFREKVISKIARYRYNKWSLPAGQDEYTMTMMEIKQETQDDPRKIAEAQRIIDSIKSEIPGSAPQTTPKPSLGGLGQPTGMTPEQELEQLKATMSLTEKTSIGETIKRSYPNYASLSPAEKLAILKSLRGK